MEIKKLEHNATEQFRQLLNVFSKAFETTFEPPPVNHLHGLLANPDFSVFTVNVNGRVVGGLTLYVLKSYYHTQPAAYIYDVAIEPEWQRNGFGKALLDEVCRYCKENGFDHVFVQAEMEDHNAVSFYRSTPFTRELNAIQFTYQL